MKADYDDLIHPHEIETTLQASGYLLEGRVAEFLESKGFYVELNSFRADPRDESKSIEIDVWGRFAQTVKVGERSLVVVEPLIECKNNSQPVAFFLKRQTVPELNADHIKYAGFPTNVISPEVPVDVPIHRIMKMSEWHHYCQASQIASQFCSFTRNFAEEKEREREKKSRLDRKDWCWKPEHMENYSKSFSALCIATQHAGMGSFTPDRNSIELEFYYPIIVFQGPIYEVSATGAQIQVRRSDHLQLHHSTSVEGRIISAQVDVVSESALPSLIETLLAELKAMVSGIEANGQRFLVSAMNQKHAARERQHKQNETETRDVQRQFEANLKGPRNMTRADDLLWAYSDLKLLRELMKKHPWLCTAPPNGHLFDSYLMRLPEVPPSYSESYVLQIAEACRNAIVPNRQRDEELT